MFRVKRHDPTLKMKRTNLEKGQLTWRSLVGDLVGQFRAYHAESVGKGAADPALESRDPIEGLRQLVGVVVHLWSR
jgi:hypothetical protein